MEKQLYNLTNPQKSIWLTEQFYSGTSINNVSGMLSIDEKVNFDILEKAINIFVKNNDSMRIQISLKNNQPVQHISSYSEFVIDRLHVTEETIEIEKQKFAIAPFNITNSELFEFIILQFPNGLGGFFVKTHHIISDAWSMSLIANQVIDIYSKLLFSEQAVHSLPIYSYCDYINSENVYLQSSKYTEDQEYWNNIFEFLPEMTKLSTKNISPSETFNSTAKRISFIINPEKTNLINTFCKENKTSPFTLFMTILFIYMSKLNNLSELTIGTPILNRSNYKEKNTVGMFISAIPFKYNVDENLSFLDTLSRISINLKNMLRHQRYSYSKILDDLRKKFSTNTGLYNILLSYQNARDTSMNSDIKYHTEWLFNGNTVEDLDIHITDFDNQGILKIFYDYRTNLFDDLEIENFHNRILYMIDIVMSNPSIVIKDMEILPDDEANVVLNQFNNTYGAYPDTKTISQIFEEYCVKCPNDIAVVFENKELSFNQLNKKANQLANILRNKGITNNSIVGIMLNRSIELIVAIMAILKSGATYLPIDPDYPEDRILYMLEDSHCSILLSQAVLNKKNVTANSIINIDLDNENIYLGNDENLTNINDIDDVAYLIYTSGSTGRPKGVMVKHRGVSNFYQAMLNEVEYLKDGNKHTIVSITTMCFDIFVYELLVSLACGVKVIMANYSQQKIPYLLDALMKEQNVDVLQTTTSIIKFQLENRQKNSAFANLKYIIQIGEPLTKDVVEQIKSVSPCKIYNAYGPTETTVYSTITEVTDIQNIHIGKPFLNTQFYVLNKYLNLLPIGYTGELYIGGAGLAKGYWNREELTNEKFIKNPFVDNTLIYETGDVGYWMSDGNLQCLGRVDNQVKINGLRIELGEIEAKISGFPGIQKSIVTVYNNGSFNQLHSFIILEDKDTFNIDDLKKFLSVKLPSYMIPLSFNIIEEMPLTPNGKINRKSPIFNIENYLRNEQIEIISPSNEIEETLLNAVLEILDNKIGVTQNFFDYGADSLSIIRLLAKLYDYEYDLKIQDFYNYPTVRSLANKIMTKDVFVEKETDNFKKITSISSISNRIGIRNFNKNANILLTGATGFLGVHLLSELIETTDTKIYCLIRASQTQTARERLINRLTYYFDGNYIDQLDKRIFIISSDIVQTGFGISDEEYNNLGSLINLVIHSAANVSHYGSYETSKDINIVGTQKIIDFCLKFNIRLHHISTMTVSGYGLVNVNYKGIFDENSFYINQDLDDNIYVKTKFTAEEEIYNALHNGLVASIYRIGNLTNRFSDGKFQINPESNAFLNRLRVMKEMEMFPMELKNVKLELTPVDFCAKAIIGIVKGKKLKKNINIYHLYNLNYVDSTCLFNIFCDIFPKLKLVSIQEFKDKLIEYLKNTSVDKTYAILADLDKNIFDSLLHESLSCDKTLKTLGKLDFAWPFIDDEYLKQIINKL